MEDKLLPRLHSIFSQVLEKLVLSPLRPQANPFPPLASVCPSVTQGIQSLSHFPVQGKLLSRLAVKCTGGQEIGY